ncbi:hypothetical protein RJ639_046653 [Escallonia herrerae]|uniref:C3H1-type domain-containing protein n=1 Tax=Escallonia herrerae TaxID=1293975 RepID=A0AA88WAC8_9ASTE|nr:hypothetical protein RJ639_046653 [Escallonia herrerae]
MRALASLPKVKRSMTMETKAANKVSVYKRTEKGQFVKNVVCSYWVAGRCNRNPCRFVHSESPPPQPKKSPRLASEDYRYGYRPSTIVRYPKYNGQKNAPVERAGSRGIIAQRAQQNISECKGARTEVKSIEKTQQKLCKYWVTGNCVQGDNCKFLHSWFCGNGFSMLTRLEGHNKDVTGIALPSGSDKLFSGSKDKSVRVWDCNTGQCAGVVNLDGESQALITEGPWVFVGLPNVIKAWNIQSQSEVTLNGPAGQVFAMVVGNDMLFAGTEDGSILVWKFSSETIYPELAASLKGHNSTVLSLVVGANRLYSGSIDRTIRMWDLDTLQCMQTLNGHTDVVTSVLCWDSFLLSGSLDNTVKVWAATESGNLKVVYEHNEESGILALCGINDAEARPILICSCNDDIVRLHDLPSFAERGRIFTRREVRAIQIGTGGLFFTGDGTGQLSVWKLLGEPSASLHERCLSL